MQEWLLVHGKYNVTINKKGAYKYMSTHADSPSNIQPVCTKYLYSLYVHANVLRNCPAGVESG